MARARADIFVTVCGAAGFIAIVITPQLVVIVIAVANFLSTVFGCLSVPGVRTLEVGVVQPSTVCGRSSAVAGIKVSEVIEINRAQSVTTLFTFTPTRLFQVA